MSRAADRCRVSQPTLSQQVRRLEASLGHALFDRLGRGVALTPAGRALLPRARRVLSELDEARGGLDEAVAGGAGRLRLGAIPTIAPYVLPAVVSRLRRRMPMASVEIEESLTESLVERLLAGELDAAIVSTPIDADGVELRVLGSEPMLVVSPGGRAASGRLALTPGSGGVTLGDLRGRPRVALHEMHCLGRQISGFCGLRRIGGEVACRTAQLSTLLEFVRLGMGLSIVPEMAAASDRAEGRRYARFQRGGPTREIALATPRGRTAHAGVGALADLVRERLTELRESAAERLNDAR